MRCRARFGEEAVYMPLAPDSWPRTGFLWARAAQWYTPGRKSVATQPPPNNHWQSPPSGGSTYWASALPSGRDDSSRWPRNSRLYRAVSWPLHIPIPWGQNWIHRQVCQPLCRTAAPGPCTRTVASSGWWEFGWNHRLPPAERIQSYISGKKERNRYL